MPQISRNHINSVVVLMGPQLVSGALVPMGTAFMVQTREAVLPPVHVYLVTCQHCIRSATIARLFDGTMLQLGRDDWTLAPEGDDLAALDVTDLLPAHMAVDQFIPLSNSIPREMANFDLGDEIYMLGLHVNEGDSGKNTPRARFGNISAWASSDTPIQQGNGNVRPTHLGDMRSRAGFSGSPVFAYYELPGLDGHVTTKTGLLGVHSDQFPDVVRLRTSQGEVPAEIPSSMTKIVPAWALSFIETDSGFQALRDRRNESHQSASGSVD